jgi:hypothetical protein
MNRRDFLKCGAGLVVSLPVVAAASQTKPQSTTLENRSHAEEAMHDEEQMELSALLDSLPWDRPQLIMISGRCAHFEKKYLASEIGKRIPHPCHIRSLFLDGTNEYDCLDKIKMNQAMKLAKECHQKNRTIICLTSNLTLSMRYMASIIFEVGYGTKDNGVYAGLAKNRWGASGAVVKLGTCQTFVSLLNAPPKDFLSYQK